MFVGHYGPAVWDTQRGGGQPLITLWQGFLLVQAIDIVWAVLNIAGVELSNQVENGVPVFHLPYSHSLVVSVALSLLVGWGFRRVKPAIGRRGQIVASALVFSHWVFDLIVHRPDLPILPGGEFVVGLGLWDYPWTAFALEVGLLGAGLAYWQRVTVGSRGSAVALWALFAVMVGLHFAFVTGPGLAVKAGTFDPAAGLQGRAFGASALVTFLALAAAIAWIERGRSPKPA